MSILSIHIKTLLKQVTTFCELLLLFGQNAHERSAHVTSSSSAFYL